MEAYSIITTGDYYLTKLKLHMNSYTLSQREGRSNYLKLSGCNMCVKPMF